MMARPMTNMLMKNIQVELEKSEKAVAGFKMPAKARIVGIEIPTITGSAIFQFNAMKIQKNNAMTKIICHVIFFPPLSFIIIL